MTESCTPSNPNNGLEGEIPIKDEKMRKYLLRIDIMEQSFFGLVSIDTIEKICNSLDEAKGEWEKAKQNLSYHYLACTIDEIARVVFQEEFTQGVHV